MKPNIMKCFLLLIVVYLSCIISAHAQNFVYRPGVNSPLVKLNFTIPDTSNNLLFKEHPQIKRIYIWYIDNHPAFIRIKDTPRESSFYDMNFKGDALDLNNKYGPINFFNPKPSLDWLYGRKKFDFPTHWEVRASVVPDSIVYSFEYRSGNRPYMPIQGYAARFQGRYEDLAQQIADGLRLGRPAVILDSVIVLQGMLGRKTENTLTDLKLVVGKQSVFSDIAMRIFGSNHNTWSAAVYDSGRNGASIIKFYIELHRNGSVSILAPKYMDAIASD